MGSAVADKEIIGLKDAPREFKRFPNRTGTEIAYVFLYAGTGVGDGATGGG